MAPMLQAYGMKTFAHMSGLSNLSAIAAEPVEPCRFADVQRWTNGSKLEERPKALHQSDAASVGDATLPQPTTTAGKNETMPPSLRTGPKVRCRRETSTCRRSCRQRLRTTVARNAYSHS